MSEPSTIQHAKVECLDHFYRQGGLRAMAPPHVHHDEPACPHADCVLKMEWIDFKLEPHNDSRGDFPLHDPCYGRPR